MANKTSGVLPTQTIRNLMKAGYIKGIPEKYLNPASLDLPLSFEAYRLEGTFLPLPGETVRKNISNGSVNAKKHDLSNPLEVGVLYIVRIDGKFKLPKLVYGYVNPKSSTGRINLFCRTVADGVHYYDTITPPGWSGEMWALIRADSFPVKITPGIALSQLRLFDDYTVLDRLQIELAAKTNKLVWKANKKPYDFDEIRLDNDGSIFLSLDLSEKTVGWECKNPSKILDLSKKYGYDADDFFSPVFVRDGRLTLRKGKFYILGTAECISVPPQFSAEIRPIDVRFGEFRTHAAGYVDPGWGWGVKGEGKGQSLTLEIIPYEDTVIRKEQIIGRIRYERVKEIPEVLYGTAKSHYTKQSSAQLSKHFKTRR